MASYIDEAQVEIVTVGILPRTRIRVTSTARSIAPDGDAPERMPTMRQVVLDDDRLRDAMVRINPNRAGCRPSTMPCDRSPGRTAPR